MDVDLDKEIEKLARGFDHLVSTKPTLVYAFDVYRDELKKLGRNERKGHDWVLYDRIYKSLNPDHATDGDLFLSKHISQKQVNKNLTFLLL